MKKLLLATALIGVIFTSLTLPTTQSPNIVLILMDDMGYGDVGCYGAVQYQTPNIDKLAAEGIRFTNFLAAQPVCTASRAALLTGCYPNRIGMTGAMLPSSKTGLSTQETTLAEMFKSRGYATAIYGKWHLGDHKAFLPLQHGFDEYLGLPYSNDMWPVDFAGNPAPEGSFKKRFNPPLPLIRGNEKIEEITNLAAQATLTSRFTQMAVDFIKRHKKRPFFLYLPHPMPHVPINASAKFRGKSPQGPYGDVMMEIDWSIGQLMNTLKETGLDKNTLVIFTSDNGPWLNYGNHAGSAGGLREGKGTSFEGGFRVPFIVRWNGTIPAGVVCNKLSSGIDILPTLAKLCNLPLPANKIDGVDISTLLKGAANTTPRKTFYYYYKKNALEAVRQDDWKLVLEHQGRTYEGFQPGKDGFEGEANENSLVALALYDLRRDPSERYDVKASYPNIVEALQQLAEAAREDLGDDITKRTGKNTRPSGMVKE